MLVQSAVGVNEMEAYYLLLRLTEKLVGKTLVDYVVKPIDVGRDPDGAVWEEAPTLLRGWHGDLIFREGGRGSSSTGYGEDSGAVEVAAEEAR